jgi:3-hydroxyisobutyrate dehydrogenase-like beta-hydroxyacid dehydrogenase
MGRPIAQHLLRAGHELHVWARRAEQSKPLTDAGAKVWPTPAQLAAQCEVVFTMVTKGEDVEQVILGADGLIEGAKPGAVVIDCSTIPPATTRRIAKALLERGIEMLDAPVSGGEKGAIEGTLSIMVGGKAGVFERMQPILGCVGKTLVYIGESGAGEVAKAANQLALIVTIQGIAEAVVFARANGVDFKPVWEALTKGFAGSRMLEIIGQRMLDQQFVMGIDASLHLKDSLIVLQCAHESRTAIPGAALAAQAFNALFARPGVKWDSAAILKVMEEMNGAAP